MRFSWVSTSLLLAAVPAAFGQLAVEKKIPVTGMTDGFDHLAYDASTHRIFATAEDQGKVYVVNLDTGAPVRTIDGFGKPHSILVRPKSPSVLVIDSERDKSALVDAKSLQRIKSLPLAPGANAMIYMPQTDRAIVTAGGDRVGMKTSQLVSVDPNTGGVMVSTEVNALHLQPMALDEPGHRVFVSIADHMSIGVFSTDKLQMSAEWKLGNDSHHHQPIAFDAAKHRLYAAIDHPGKLVVMNSDTGHIVSSIDIPGDADDLVFDPVSRHLLVPCGDGYMTLVDIAQPDRPRVLQKLATGSDAGTGIWLAREKKFLLGVPKSGSMQLPEIWVFNAK